MTERFANVLALYGREAVIRNGEQAVTARVFLQPVTQMSDAAPYAVTSLGTADDRRWRCITRTALADGGIVECGGARYRVESCAAVYAGRELSHWWGVLTREREAAE